MKKFLAGLCLVALTWAATQFFTVFVVQPIGAVPDGGTVIITRLSTMNFIDSADGWCERQTGSVNLLCRGAVMAKVAQNSTIVARAPYIEALYKISTGGKTYER